MSWLSWSNTAGCWRTLHGLADIAIVQSYLSTATKWDLDQHDTLYQLVTPVPGYHQRPNPAECLPLAVLQMKRRSLRTAVTRYLAETHSHAADHVLYSVQSSYR